MGRTDRLEGQVWCEKDKTNKGVGEAGEMKGGGGEIKGEGKVGRNVGVKRQPSYLLTSPFITALSKPRYRKACFKLF